MKSFFLALVLSVPALVGCNDANRKSVASIAPTSPAPPALESGLPWYPHAQTNLQRMKVYVGAAELDAALALQPLERQTGMMWRTNMEENEAMLFPFPAPHRASFYMKWDPLESTCRHASLSIL